VSDPYLPAPYQSFGGLIAGRENRAFAKRLRDLYAQSNLELARVRATELVEIAKLEAVETTGHIGLASAASLAAHRRFRAEQEPDAAAVYDYVVERSIRAIGERIEGLNRRLDQ